MCGISFYMYFLNHVNCYWPNIIGTRFVLVVKRHTLYIQRPLLVATLNRGHPQGHLLMWPQFLSKYGGLIIEGLPYCLYY